MVFDELSGDYVMVLSDDDWLDHNYLSSCLAELHRTQISCLHAGSDVTCAMARW